MVFFALCRGWGCCSATQQYIMQYSQGTAVLTKSEHSAEGHLKIALEISKSGLKRGGSAQ